MRYNKKQWLVILIFILPILTFAQESSLPSGANQPLELTVVREMKFENLIKDIALGTTIEENKEFVYPRIIFFDKEIIFYDKNSKDIARVSIETDKLPLPKVSFSPKGQYVGIKTYDSGKEMFKVYTEFGKMVSKTEIVTGTDQESWGWEFYISDKDGSFVASYGKMNKLIFYDSIGNIKKEINLFEKTDYQLERGVSCTFSDDGKNLIVLATKIANASFHEMPADTPYLYVILFDGKGNELWRNPLEGNFYKAFSISSTGKFTCVGDDCQNKDISSAHFYLFKNSGELIGKYNIKPSQPFAPFCKFSNDEEFVVLANYNTIQLIETNTGKVLWTKQFPWNINRDMLKDGVRYIYGIDIADSASTIGIVSFNYRLIENYWNHSSQQLDILNSKGELLFNQVFSESEKADLSLENRSFVFVSRDGNQVLLPLQKGIKFFEKYPGR